MNFYTTLVFITTLITFYFLFKFLFKKDKKSIEELEHEHKEHIFKMGKQHKKDFLKLENERQTFYDEESDSEYDSTEGEKEMSELLKTKLDKKKYHIFNNLIIKNNWIGSSEIDHLVLSVYGIFVIENKDYNCWIFGKKIWKEWTAMYNQRVKKLFLNPLNQNYGHIKALQEITEAKEENIFNVVAFSHNSELKNNVENVFHYDEVIDYIKDQKKEKITQMRLEQIIGKIEISKRINIISLKKHVENIKKKYNK